MIADILLTDEPLRTAPGPLSEGAGAVVDFLGVVRKMEGESELSGIFYEAHRPMAQHQFEKLVAAAGERFEVQAVALHHRLGFVPVAESSLFVRVTAKHRAPAFGACSWMIDELKRIAPIWKKPVPGGVAACA